MPGGGLSRAQKAAGLVLRPPAPPDHQQNGALKMAKTTVNQNAAELIRLDAGHNFNWNIDAAPVAVLNETSTLHDRIAYCWGVAERIHELTGFFMESNSPEVRRIGSMLHCHADPLVAVLERLGDDTAPGRG